LVFALQTPQLFLSLFLIQIVNISKLVDCQTGEDLAEVSQNPFIDNCQNDKRPPHGELWLRSDCVMAGYLNESDGLNQSTIDQEGWFHTGK
jgi:long-subunit acyl-CoA synthetase (AMP-forming)